MTNINLSVTEKISRAKIQIQHRNSFFAYLSLFLKFREDTKNELPESCMGMGVNIRGDCIYKKEFIEELTKDKTASNPTELLEGVIIHEILHLALLHLQRGLGGNHEIVNIAQDIVVNSLLTRNNFKLPEGCLLPNSNNEITLFEKTPYKQTIKDCDKKTAEKVYDEIKIPNKNGGGFCVKISGKGKGKGKGGLGKNGLSKEDLQKGRFDVHIEGKGLTPKEKKELSKEWNNRIYEALNVARMKGDIPNGMERLLGKLHEEKINWRTLLNRYIINQLPYDYSWASSSKKSIATGVYMPNTLKEKIDVVIGIDVSGSIGQKELTDFLSEIIGIAKAFQERIDMKLITHECDIVDEFEIKNGNIEKIKSLKIKGGGGTAHDKIFNHIQDKIRDCKCAIFLTDGYSDLNEIEFKKYNFDKLFVISDGGDDSQLKGKKCNIIHLKD